MWAWVIWLATASIIPFRFLLEGVVVVADHIPMRLMLRQEWKPRAFNSVLGFMDIKTGTQISALPTLVVQQWGLTKSGHSP
jgi:hypothetical protein